MAGLKNIARIIQISSVNMECSSNYRRVQVLYVVLLVFSIMLKSGQQAAPSAQSTAQLSTWTDFYSLKIIIDFNNQYLYYPTAVTII